VDADPYRQVHFIAAANARSAGERPLDPQGGEQRPLDVVFLRHRSAEKRHEAVTGKLRRRASVAIDLGEAGGEKGADKVPHRLRPKPFGERHGADDVTKQDGDLFHFAG